MINLEESYLLPRYRRLTWKSRTSYLAIDDNFEESYSQFPSATDD